MIQLHPSLSYQNSSQEFQLLYSLRKRKRALKATKLHKIYKQFQALVALIDQINNL